VVGVDISEKMIEWSRQRAKQEGIEDRVELRTADVLDLPFEADRFDIVICESVLAFVEDKPRAIRECARVVKPGGYVGMNEALWIEQPPPERTAQALEWGTNVLTAETWQALWEESGLQDRQVRTYQIDARTEIRSRIRWIGWSWILKAWYRVLSLYLKNPAARRFIKEQLGSTPREMFGYLGYGLFVGRK
jgi:SAM-dependent methyltransferase